jgi:hypothetical protein
LLAAVARGQVQNVIGRTKLALGRVPPGARGIDVAGFTAPDSRLAREAEAACDEQPGTIIGHSYRTWLYGHMLAALDGEVLDPELFYCAALLHDHGISAPVAGQDFTLRSAERAIACARAAGLADDEGEEIGDAICVHATAGAVPPTDGGLGTYVQQGAMVDVAGMRLWDVAPANRDEVLHRHPREPHFKPELTRMVRAEAAAVPTGRFAHLVRCGFPLAIRMAPYKD